MSQNQGGKPVNAGSEKAARDNRANQLNSNNDAYWKSRGQTPPATSKSGSKGSGR